MNNKWVNKKNYTKTVHRKRLALSEILGHLENFRGGGDFRRKKNVGILVHVEEIIGWHHCMFYAVIQFAIELLCFAMSAH